MRCEIAAQELWLLAAGELAGEEATQLTEHVATCDRCRERLQQAAALFGDTGVDAVRPVAPPVDAKAQLMARVAATGPRRQRWPWAVAAAALVGAVLGAGVASRVAEERFAPVGDKLRFELALVRESHRKQEARLAQLNARLEEMEREARAVSFPVGGGDAPAIGPPTEQEQSWQAFLQWAEESRPRPAGWRPSLDTTAQVYCLESEGLCVLRAAGLPETRGDQSYALWVTNVAGRYHLVGTFEADHNGEASLLASSPVRVQDVTRSLITLESGEAGWRPEGSVVLVDETLAN